MRFSTSLHLGLLGVLLASAIGGCGVAIAPTEQAGGIAASAKASSKGGFPKGFLWGVATAGFQVEGGDKTSNWAAWERNGKTKEPMGKAIDHWNRYQEDADLAKKIGMNAYRMSLEWARIEPKKGQFDPAAIKHYHDELSALRARGIEPVVTLVHFSYPAWLDEPDADGNAGWESSRMAEEVGRFATWAGKEYGSKVRWWLTINEPNTIAYTGHLAGMHPPGKRNPLALLRSLKTMVLAHKTAFNALHAADRDAQVSINPIVIDRDDRIFNALPETPLLSPISFLDALTPSESPSGRKATVENKSYLDYMAFNYFYGLRAHAAYEVLDYLKWPIHPTGIYENAKKLYNRYHLPLMVTENGIAIAADQPRKDGWTREAYLVQHLAQLQRASSEGIPVLGYMHWTLADNYEWGTWAPRFGLYTVDPKDPTLTRKATPGAEVYRQIATANGVSAELLKRFPAPGK